MDPLMGVTGKCNWTHEIIYMHIMWKILDLGETPELVPVLVLQPTIYETWCAIWIFGPRFPSYKMTGQRLLVVILNPNVCGIRPIEKGMK